jgi:hypothetical protein
MKSVDWKTYAELVGITAIVASLIFVGLQLRQEQAIAVAALGQSEIEIRAELILGMSEHAVVWDKSNRGEPLTDPEMLIMKGQIDAWFRRAIVGANNRDSLGGSGKTAGQLFAILLFENPGARDIWKAQQERERDLMRQMGPESAFIDRYADEIHENLKKLDELNQ